MDGESTIHHHHRGCDLAVRLLPDRQSASIKKRGDVDQNGELESIDVTLLQRWLLGLDQELNIGKKV